jgi:hypothetical protein
MLVGSAPDPPTAVFYDPTGRRRHALLMLLIATVSGAAVALSLLIIGLTGGGHPPRTVLGPSPVTGRPSLARHGAADRSPAPYPSISRPAGLPALPTWPAP